MQDFILTVYIVTVYNTVNDQFYSIIYRFIRDVTISICIIVIVTRNISHRIELVFREDIF